MDISAHHESGRPAFGICGYSGSGKTTLIEALISRLRGRGLTVGVIKQDAHGLQLDREGKDTDRIFKAGGDVLIRDKEQVFVRLHGPAEADVHTVIRRMESRYDVILVEGHKSSALSCKIWLSKADDDTYPPEAVGIRRNLRWNEDRERIAWDMLDEWLRTTWLATPVYAGILAGGAGTRAARPGRVREASGQTPLRRTVAALKDRVDKVIVLGGGELPDDLRSLPVLPDADDAEGPLRGMRAAMRWAPRVGWLFVASDHADASSAAVEWLLSHRGPGVRAVLPILSGSSAPDPFLAYYDFRMASAIERVRQPLDLAYVPGVATPTVPAAFATS